MNIGWDDLRLFLAVAESGSFSAAARQLRLGQATLSRRMGELESQLGEALFERHRLGIQLSPAGERLMPAAQRMAEWAIQANQSLILAQEQRGATLNGTIKIAAPPGIAFELLVPIAAKLRQQQPHLSVEILSGIELLNLARGEADIALRVNPPSDADIVVIDEVHCAIRAYASHEYAQNLQQQFSRPLQLSDLAWICWAKPYEDLFTNQALRAAIPNFKPAFSSDDFLVQLQACKAGLGAMILAKAPHHYAQILQLHELDIDLGAQAQGSLYLLCHKRQRELPKVKWVLGLISAEFAAVREMIGQ